MSLSRRDFLASSAMAAIFSAIGRPTSARAWQTPPAPQTPTPAPAPADAVFTPIRRNVGFFTMRGGTIGYLVDPSAVVVVDSQYAASGKACLDGLNARSNNHAVDFLINTHHHADHTEGNISFKGSAKHVVAQARAAELMKNPPGAQPPSPDQLFPDTTFTDAWAADAGGERMRARFYGPAHTSGDVVVTFERANVAHMGDVMFNQRHPIVDRAAGASITNWINVMERVPRDHDADTIYVFGHAGAGLPVTGNATDLGRFRDYLVALRAFVEAQIKAGRSREDILAMRDPLTVMYEELTAG